MPKMRKPTLPKWADPAEKSVFDNPMETVARKVATLVGADQPPDVTSIPVGGELATPLVSIYKNVAARNGGLMEFLNGVVSKYGESHPLTEASRYLAMKYPRVAAHMRLQDAVSTPHESWNAAAIMPNGTNAVSAPLDVEIYPGFKRSLARSYNPTADAKETLFHEATHVAQRLGNKHFTPLYTNTQDLTGYVLNPFEYSALRAGKKATGRPLAKGEININAADIADKVANAPDLDKIPAKRAPHERVPSTRDKKKAQQVLKAINTVRRKSPMQGPKDR